MVNRVWRASRSAISGTRLLGDLRFSDQSERAIVGRGEIERRAETSIVGAGPTGLFLGMALARRGEQIDLSRPLPSDLICSVSELEPSMMPTVGAYRGMLAGPSVLSSIEPLAREHLKNGFRPSVPEGPSRDELIEPISGAT